MVFFFDITKIVSEYDQKKPQSQTVGKPRHCEEEQHNIHDTPGRQKKQTNQHSLPHRNDCKTRHKVTHNK